MASSRGYLDTNVVLHALANDTHSRECRAFLDLLERGELTAMVDVTVLHELSYTISRYRREFNRDDVGRLLIWLVNLKGVDCDRELFTATIKRWGAATSLGFVDAHLTELAKRAGASIFTKNGRDFSNSGVNVPDPLPTGSRTSTS